MTYRTWRGDDLVCEESAEFDCHVISDETLTEELSAVGLERHPATPREFRHGDAPTCRKDAVRIGMGSAPLRRSRSAEGSRTNNHLERCGRESPTWRSQWVRGG
jgi:hypothetical protein